MVHNGNRRWDNLQKRVTAILRRLRVPSYIIFLGWWVALLSPMKELCSPPVVTFVPVFHIRLYYLLGCKWCLLETSSRFDGLILSPQHFISQREEFETARDSILVWLTEMDLQLTNIEHFSECDVQAKIKQLRVRRSQLWVSFLKITNRRWRLYSCAAMTLWKTFRFLVKLCVYLHIESLCKYVWSRPAGRISGFIWSNAEDIFTSIGWSPCVSLVRYLLYRDLNLKWSYSCYYLYLVTQEIHSMQ